MFFSEENLKRMYINNSRKMQKTMDNCHFVLKYDYTSDRIISKLESILECQKAGHNSRREIIDVDTTRPFYEYFFEVLDELDSDKIFNLMSSYYFRTEFAKDKTKTIRDLTAGVYVNKTTKEYSYLISGPEPEKETAMLFASYAHELIHLPQLCRKRHYEYLEYSEVLSMFFEYLIYEKICGSKGKKIFLNNRISMLHSIECDFETDLYYARNNHLLNAPRDIFVLPLADAVSYYEGIEYVLSLIEYASENKKKKISDLIYRILFDQSSMKDEAAKLRIDTSKCSKVLKLL